MNITIRQGSMGKTTVHRSMRRQCMVGFVAMFALLAQSAVALCCGAFAHADMLQGNTHPPDCPSLTQTAASGEAPVDGLSDELVDGEQCLHPAAALCAAHALPPVSASVAPAFHLYADMGADLPPVPDDAAFTAWSPGHYLVRSWAAPSGPVDGSALFLTTRRLRL